MPHIPYVPADLREPEGIVGRIRARRGGKLLNLDRMLLHSPNFAQGWNSLLGATRSELSLAPQLRELTICAVGVLNAAEYEVQQHTPPYLEAGGTSAKLQAIRNIGAALNNTTLFDQTERAALQLAVAMTRRLSVPATLMQQLRALLGSDQLVVELVGVVAVYNMVSRFLVALDVGLE